MLCVAAGYHYFIVWDRKLVSGAIKSAKVHAKENIEIAYDFVLGKVNQAEMKTHLYTVADRTHAS